VDVTGDGIPDIVVGAIDEDTRGSSAGAVLLFSGADCTLVRKMTDPDGQNYDYLGHAVAFVGDVSGDGVPDIATGVRGDDVGDESAAGSVVIFSGDTGAVIRKILNPDARTQDEFGFAVVGLEDVDGDTVPDLAVAAIGDDTLIGSGSGSISVISGADGSSVRTLVIPGGAANANLGTSLARIADLDGDGLDDILAGAPGVDDPLPNSGVVVALSPRDGALIRTFADPLAGSNIDLGTSVSAVPDLDGDGVTEVLSGAPQDDTAGSNAGLAVLFSGATGTVLQRLTDPLAGDGDGFGTAVTALPDVTGGGLPELIVAAPLVNTVDGSDVGALTIFASEADCDGDGFNPLLDCDDGDPATQGLPGPAEDLSFLDPVSLAWNPPSGYAGDPGSLFYDVIRSTMADDFELSAVCAEADDGGDTEASIPGAPGATGQAWFFLVRSENRCGSGGSGSDSADVPRSVRTCP
jgi:hypothetical protein